MSWWDYGYQITAMANRTILVDNNTWNNTHISRVGQVGAPAPRPRLRALWRLTAGSPAGNGLDGGESLRDHARAGRELRAGDIRRPHRLLVRW